MSISVRCKGLRNILFAVGLSVSGVPAWAETPMLLGQSTAAVATNALMQPILPLLPSEAGSTTSISQIGNTNFANASATGSGNLSLIQQTGTNNRAVQAVQGNSSAMLLVQGGRNNSVLQASQGDRNFQLVGVSGENNDVAYLQMGNDLAGALDVTNSHNASVLAIQTPQSGRYLMPTGLRGLQNAAVLIVPGRMYVLPKR